MHLRCNTCQGVYQPLQRDGVRYFHACPPVYDPVTELSVERADKRDENILQDAKTLRVSIKAEGRGAVAVTVIETAEVVGGL